MSQVDLVLPGLLNLPLAELQQRVLLQQTPALNHLLSFARPVANHCHDFDQVLIQCLGLHQAGLPYAHAVQASDQGSASLLIKALHLRPDINNAILYPLQKIQDKNIIINDLSDYFKVDCQITAQADDIFLMQLHEVDAATIPITPHYLSVLGKQISSYLQQARSSLPWYKLLNEMQMFMHQHEFNQQRLQQGQATINSLWCWGNAGYAGESFNQLSWYSDDWLMQRLGRLYSGQCQPLSAVADDQVRRDMIIIDLSLLRLLKGDSTGDLQQALTDFDLRCLQPLLASGVTRLRIHTAGSHNFHYRPLHRWKFWQKNQTVLDLAGQLDSSEISRD